MSSPSMKHAATLQALKATCTCIHCQVTGNVRVCPSLHGCVSSCSTGVTGAPTSTTTIVLVEQVAKTHVTCKERGTDFLYNDVYMVLLQFASTWSLTIYCARA